MTQNPNIHRQPESEDTTSPLSILVVEDVKLNRELIWIVLNDGGHNVCAVENGEKALEKLQEKKFDVILLDIQLPGLNGQEIARIIRSCEQGINPGSNLPESLTESLTSRLQGNHLPIIAMTGHAAKEDRERYLQTGMDDYISKPFDPDDLLATLTRVTTMLER